MLVLLGPSFDGSNESYQRLAEATGLVAYDLRSRIKPGWWGVIRALGDVEGAESMATRLRNEGFPVVAVDLEAAANPDRRIVKLQAVRFESSELVLRVRDREMPIPYAALLVVVRGELGGAAAPASRASSSTFRAVVPSTSESQSLREASAAHQVADLHFHTVKWVARVDARSFDFSRVPGAAGHSLRDLEALVEELARRSGVRVDRGSKMSSLSSYALQGQRRLTPLPGQSQDPADPFDAYSRLVAEAEATDFRGQALANGG